MHVVSKRTLASFQGYWWSGEQSEAGSPPGEVENGHVLRLGTEIRAPGILTTTRD